MPGPSSSPACLTVIWFLSAFLLLGRAQTLTNEVSGVQYGRLESNVTLACGTSPVGTPVEWRLNDTSALPWHQVTSDGALVLLYVDQSAQGNYSCYDDRGLLLHSTILKLGHPPGLLSVSCRVPNHTLVRCKWVESVKTFLPTEYHATYRRMGQEWKPCVVNSDLQHCDITQPAFWHSAPIWVQITQTNALGSTPTNVQIRLHELLKPDPPESVSVQAEVGYPTRLVVSWRYPSSWPIHQAFPLTFEIRYRPAGSTHWSQIECNDSVVKLFDALAGYLHQVQVRAQDGVDTDSQWSDWSAEGLGQPWQAYSTGEPAEDFLPGDLFPDDVFPDAKPDTSTVKTPSCGVEEECNLGLVILLVLFSVFVFITVLSLILVLWVRQRRRNHETKQELTSMVKMKSMPI